MVTEASGILVLNPVVDIRERNAVVFSVGVVLLPQSQQYR
jgi:hypothetical protein